MEKYAGDPLTACHTSTYWPYQAVGSPRPEASNSGTYSPSEADDPPKASLSSTCWSCWSGGSGSGGWGGRSLGLSC